MAKRRKQTIDAPRGTVFKVWPEELVIVADKDDPLYDERIELPLDERFVHNIMWRGVMQPVAITKDKRVVYGRQRVRGAIEANKRLKQQGKEPMRIKAEVYRGTNDTDLFGVIVSENEQRRDDGPLAKARKAQRMKQFHATDEEICAAFGVTKQTLRNWEALIDLPKTIQKAVDKHEINASSALQLAKLKPDKQKEKFEELKAAGGKITAERTKRAVDKDDNTPHKRKRMRSRKEVEEKLQELDIAGRINSVKLLRWVLCLDDATD